MNHLGIAICIFLFPLSLGLTLSILVPMVGNWVYPGVMGFWFALSYYYIFKEKK